MLTIRRAQMALFEGEMFRAFLEKMIAHLRIHLAECVAPFNDAQLLRILETEAQRGRDYGLSSERDLCRFLNLMAVFGWNFDNAPEGAWLKRQLSDLSVQSPSERLNRAVKDGVRRIDIEAENRNLEMRSGAAANLE